MNHGVLMLLLALAVGCGGEDNSAPSPGQEERSVNVQQPAEPGVVGWRFRAPQEDYERRGRRLDGKRGGEATNPYLMEMWRNLSSPEAAVTTGALRAAYGDPKMAEYVGTDVLDVATRNNKQTAGWWFEKVNDQGEFEGVLVFFLAGNIDSEPALTMFILTRKFVRAKGSAAFTPGLAAAFQGAKAIKAAVQGE